MSDDRVKDIYKGRLYQNWKGFTLNLLFLAVILVVYALTEASLLFFIVLGLWIVFLVVDLFRYADRRRKE